MSLMQYISSTHRPIRTIFLDKKCLQNRSNLSSIKKSKAVFSSCTQHILQFSRFVLSSIVTMKHLIKIPVNKMIYMLIAKIYFIFVILYHTRFHMMMQKTKTQALEQDMPQYWEI